MIDTGNGHCRPRLLGLVLLFFSASLLVPGSDRASAKPGYFELRSDCKSQVGVPYFEPLSKMKPVHRVPRSEKLGFGPKQLRIQPMGWGVVEGNREIGFALRRDGISASRPIDVNWGVRTTLTRADRSGAKGKLLATRDEHAETLFADDLDEEFSFTVSRRPAFYKVQIAFFSSAGERLGSFAEYFRVVKRRPAVVLGLAKTRLHVGERLVWRVENRGTTFASFGLTYSIERYQDGAWTVDPVSPDGFTLPALSIGPGLTEECPAVKLDNPGHYRFRKPVSIAGERSRELAVDFHVLP